MAQIRSKQIKDFLSTVNWAEVTNAAVPNASDVKSYVNDGIASLESDVVSIETVQLGLISDEAETARAAEQANADAISVLEAAIIEDDQMAVETFVGAAFSYTLANPVQEDQASLVDVFVNGHRVFVATVSGANVALANPGYTVDSQDEVVFVYQF